MQHKIARFICSTRERCMVRGEISNRQKQKRKIPAYKPSGDDKCAIASDLSAKAFQKCSVNGRSSGRRRQHCVGGRVGDRTHFRLSLRGSAIGCCDARAHGTRYVVNRKARTASSCNCSCCRCCDRGRRRRVASWSLT
jgi:hypothetical protein